MTQDYSGQCHCGSVRFRVHLDIDDAIVCDCSICTKKGSIVVRVEESEFELLSPIDELSVYTFHTHIAKHYFCPSCGVHTFHRPRTYPDLWGVNVRCLTGVDIGALEPRQVFGSKLD